jgi:signal transduction histidine kinase
MRPEDDPDATPGDGAPDLESYDPYVYGVTSWLRRNPAVVDGLVVGVLLLAMLPTLRESQAGLALPVLLAMVFPLIWRREYPITVFAVVSGAAFVQWLADIPVRAHDLAVLIALYAVAAYARDRRAPLVAAAVAMGGALLVVARWHQAHFVAALVGPAALTLFALALGDDRRNRLAYFAELEERADRLERERDALAQVAAAAERSRIAREMHDIIAHSLSVIVAQADGAAYTVDDDPRRARQAMLTVAEIARASLTETRRLLGVLRPDSQAEELAPQPGVGQIAELVARVRDAGLPVELEVEPHAEALPSGMELAAYRIVQEALTNTMKHSGPGATAHVAIRCREGGLEIRVEDDGAGIRSPGPVDAGHGLTGMRERAAMYGGTLHAGPLPGGGFAVEAEFPAVSARP